MTKFAAGVLSLELHGAQQLDVSLIIYAFPYCHCLLPSVISLCGSFCPIKPRDYQGASSEWRRGVAAGAGGGQREGCQHGYTHRWRTTLTSPRPTGRHQVLYHCFVVIPHLGIELEIRVGLVDPGPGLLSDGVLGVPGLLEGSHLPPALPLGPLQLLLRGFNPLQRF